jgi:cytochrome c oxidase subunit 2
LTPAQFGAFFLALGLVSMLVALFFWALGARVITLFAGAEIAGRGPGLAVNDLPGRPGRQPARPAPAGVTKHRRATCRILHYIMLVICVVIFVAVFGVMFYSILKHRKSVGHKAANFHESVAVEIAWTVVPFIIVIGMGAMATAPWWRRRTPNADLTIKATGYQWKWGYDYLKGEGEGISFLSTLDVRTARCPTPASPQGDNYLLKVDNPLVVPVDRKIRIVTTANDVIHAWMVPALRRQAGRHSRLRARHLVPRREDR